MNIKKYIFSDILVKWASHANSNAVNITLRGKVSSCIIYRDDAIALAKHFKLTANDLNTD